MEPIHERVAGIDVHRMKHVVTVLISGDGGAVSSETREFGGFKRDMRALVDWLRSHRIQQVVMESTGIYWKSVFSHLETAEIPALVVLGFWFIMQFFSGTAALTTSTNASSGGVAWWAHVGGFVIGIILVGLFPRKDRPRYDYFRG